MEGTTIEDSPNQMYSLSVQINNLFIKNSKSSDQNNKWLLLKEYHTKYLMKDKMSVVLFSSYHSITSTLLDALKPTLFSEKWQENQFDEVFLNGIEHEAFMILVRKLVSTSESYQQLKILNLLAKFLQGRSIDSLILQQCLSQGSWDPEYIAASSIWNDLITLIVSLPERVANRTRGVMHKIFHMDYYVPLLISSVIRVLSSLHQKITESQNCTLEFIGKLVGKLCILGNSVTITQRLSLILIRRSENDQIWRRICQNLITKMPFSSLEPFVTQLLLAIPWFGYVDWFLGVEGKQNTKLCYILTTKLLLMRHFKKAVILQNVIGYFAGYETRKHHFWDILTSLLKTWSDESALKHQSFEQQKYLASALVVCAGWIKELKDADFQGEAYMDKALYGTTIRIGNSEECVRQLGMIVGGLLLSALNPEGPKLQFEDSVDKELLAEFKDLLIIPTNPGTDFLNSKDLNCLEEVKLEDNQRSSDATVNNVTETLDNNLHLDSDDDLEAYDMSSDVPQEKVKRPFFLNDCLQGLIEQENADWFEQCLKHSEGLIKANSEIVQEVAVEMAKVVLHLDDKYCIQDFNALRRRILVSLTVHVPVLVAEYLTEQFYEMNYNISQRLDILDVLACASRELSKPPTAQSPAAPEKWHSKEKFAASVEKTWKSIVDQRIAAKTRYISKTPKQSLPEMQNRFSAVAGYFFYPLLAKYDKSHKMLRLFGEDSYVLGRLIYTLSVVMLSASNTPISKSMGETLLQFLADVRNHTDVFVRQASIFAIATVYSSVPGFLLLSGDMVNHVEESKHWLQSIIDEDPDTTCQLKATYALSFLFGVIKQEAPQISGILNN